MAKNFRFISEINISVKNFFKKKGVGILLLLFFSFFAIFSSEISALSITPSVTIVTLSAPTNLTAIASSPYQIDLSWDSVTEADYYKIYREGSFIASTTQVSYSDIGLSSATTYTYKVSALDSGGTESSQSDSASATTLSLPSLEAEETGGPTLLPPPPENPSVVINNNLIYTNSVKIFLSLFAKNASIMAISNNPDFSGDVWENYQPQKEWFLTPGEGEKKVYAKFRSFAGGVSNVVSDSIIFDSTPPLNVSNLGAKAQDREIGLKWENPLEKDFGGVMIVRSTIFYPTHIYEGVLVYKGADIFFLDKGVENGSRYYYTVFSFDKAGNFSSGAVISEIPRFSLAPEVPPEIPPEIPPQVPPEEVPPIVRELTLEDFNFIQEGKKLLIFDKETVRVEPEKPLTIFVDYEKLPEVLKTIMVTLKKDGKTFSFLLKIDGDKKQYSAVILPPEPEIYAFDIFIINYKNQSLKKISGKMIIKKIGILELGTGWAEAQKPEIRFSILWLIILLVFLTYIIRKKRRKRREEKYPPIGEKQEIKKVSNGDFDGLDSYSKKE
ncbi:MAG: hypothetical protein NTU58_02350 [Candidatus Nealsonbacteria bacterium]|nr:hypothetical protein [Candidatus Nealsonbacteria bacterium]